MNKYRNKKTICKQGHKHDSKLEAKYCNDLEFLEKAGKIWSYDIQVRFDLYCNDIYICFHKVDFLVRTNNFDDEVHEVKGKKLSDWIIKKKLFEANYPDIKYIVIGDK